MKKIFNVFCETIALILCPFTCFFVILGFLYYMADIGFHGGKYLAKHTIENLTKGVIYESK